MKRVIIHNVGPISHVDIELNKVNVIMGPQSSGKSTIAKVISYCQWVEKRFILDGKFEYKFNEQFINFHRIDENYFSEDSLIQYESEFISIKYEGEENKQTILEKGDSTNYLKAKNIYIPAERNFVSVIPNLGKYKESNDNIMSFLYDWYDAKRNYSKKKSLSILNLGVDYHHIQTSDSDVLNLSKNNKEISLQKASSGLQSVIPLIMLIDYLSGDFFNKEHSLSIAEREYLLSILKEEIKSNEEKIKSNEEKIKSYGGKIKPYEDKKSYEDKQPYEDKNTVTEKRTNYNYSNFIIEEPEQNLFPETQRDLVYFILDKINNSERAHTAILTTHSPYILYALNNCMMGYNVKDDIPEEVKSELLSSKYWINTELVSVWEVEKGGTLKSIKDEKTGTVSKHYFNRVMNDVMNEYYEMLNYFDV